MSPLVLDTSVAVPLLVTTHAAHRSVVEWWAEREVSLVGHSLVETYSVLTRLPGDLRREPAECAQLLHERFGPPLLLGSRTARRLPAVLAALDVAGGAVYDALVALAAREHGAVLATRDGRARATYDAVGVVVQVAG